jgi:hypothetical protein
VEAVSNKCKGNFFDNEDDDEEEEDFLRFEYITAGQGLDAISGAKEQPQ